MGDDGIKAYQIYYDESQKDSLMDGFIPHFNEKATINLESGIICDLVNQGECSNCDWFGVFSWKVQDKVRGLNFNRLQRVIRKNKEADFFAPKPRNYCFPTIQTEHNYRLQDADTMGGLWAGFDLLVKKLGISDGKVLSGSGHGVYFNSFLARPEIYLDYVNSLLKPAIELCASDEELSTLVMSPSGYAKPPPQNFINDTGVEQYPWIPFILERLINVYIEVNDIKVGWKL